MAHLEAQTTTRTRGRVRVCMAHPVPWPLVYRRRMLGKGAGKGTAAESRVATVSMCAGRDHSHTSFAGTWTTPPATARTRAPYTIQHGMPQRSVYI